MASDANTNNATDEITEAIVEGDYRGTTDVTTAIQGLNNPDQSFYSSIKSDSFAGKLALAAAINNSEPIADHVGEQIELENFIVQSVEIADKDGLVNTAPRVTLVATGGIAYHATSVGLLQSVRSIIAFVGEPSTWEAPIPVKIVEKRGRSGYRYMTIEFV